MIDYTLAQRKQVNRFGRSLTEMNEYELAAQASELFQPIV
jgi:hypothetical protein